MLARSALRGVAWNWSGSAILVVAQVASTAATARLVSPREFGLYAAAQAVYGFAGFFCMRAVGQELQRRSDLTPHTVRTAMSIVLAASLLIAAGVGFGAPLWADLWGAPAAAPAMRVFAVALLLQSAATVPLALLRRDLRFGRAAVLETGALVTGMAAGVALAAQLHSAVGLSIGQLAGATVLLATTAWTAGHDLRPSVRRAEVARMSAFASQVGGLGFVGYCAGMLPSLFVARELGPYVLGLFSRARQLAELPADYAVTGIYKVIYPLYGKVRDDTARTQTLIREALSLATGFIWPAFMFLAGSSQLVVNVVLGERWGDSAPLLALFALGSCAFVPTGLLSNCAEALGWMRILAWRLGAFFVGVGMAVVVAVVAGLGAEGLLLCVAIVQWATYLATLRPFVRRGMLLAGETVRQQAIHALLAALAFALGALCVELAPASLLLEALVLCGGGATLVAVLVLCRPMFPAGRILTRRLAQARA